MRRREIISQEVKAFILSLTNKQLAIQLLKARHGGNTRWYDRLQAELQRRKARE